MRHLSVALLWWPTAISAAYLFAHKQELAAVLIGIAGYVVMFGILAQKK